MRLPVLLVLPVALVALSSRCDHRTAPGATAPPHATPGTTPTTPTAPPAPVLAVDLPREAARANHCERDTDCESIGSVCGIGCYVLVHRAEAERMRALVRTAAEQGGVTPTCTFTCVAPQPLHCVDARCVMGR